MGLDAQFSRRPIDPGQLAQWASLVTAIAVGDDDDDILGADDLAENFTDSKREFGRGSVAVYDGAAMIAHCTLIARAQAEPVHQMRLWGGVHPRYRRRGIGTWLLDWAEQAARPIHQDRFPGAALALQGGCLGRNASATALFEARGFQPARWFRSMRRDLAEPLPACQVPSGVRIVPFTIERSPDARLVRNEAFRDHWGSTQVSVQDWQHSIADSAFRPGFSFLAYRGAAPVGVVLGHEYDTYNQVKGIRDVHVPLVGTLASARKQGIASALLVRVLTVARDDGCLTASLGVDADSPTGAPGVYEGLGFVGTDTWIALVKPLPDEPLPGEQDPA